MKALLERRNMFLILSILALSLFAIGCGNGEGGETAGTSPTENSAAAEQGASSESDIEFPTKDVEFVVPFPPGGGYDIWGRTLAPFIEKHLPGDHNVVVVNQPGAGGITAASALHRSKPDGHSIQIFNVGGLVGSHMSGQSPFDLRDFTWLAQITKDDEVAMLSPKHFKSLTELKEADGEIIAAMEGLSANSTMIAILVFQELGIKNWKGLLHDSKQESILSAIRGDAHFVSGSFNSVRDYFNDLPPAVVFADEPVEGYEHIPLAKEFGLEHLNSVVSQTRMLGTAPDTDPKIVAILDKAIGDAMKDPEFLSQLEAIDYTAIYLNAEEATKQIDNVLGAYEKYEGVIKEFMESR